MNELTTIKGIGEATAAKLVAIGISTIALLAAANAAEVAKKDGFGTEAQVADWIEQAKELVSKDTEEGGNADATVLTSPIPDEGAGEANAETSQADADATPAGDGSQGINTTQSEADQGGAGNGAGPAEGSSGDVVLPGDTDADHARLALEYTVAGVTGNDTPSEADQGGSSGDPDASQALNLGLDFGSGDAGGSTIAVFTQLGTVMFRDADHTREIKVTGPRVGRWRAGMHFGAEARPVPVNASQLQLIDNDPALSWVPVATED